MIGIMICGGTQFRVCTMKMIMMIWTIGRAPALPFWENIEGMEATKFFRTSNVRKIGCNKKVI